MVLKTRFAPSPTGDLHLGGIRTALYNWAWREVIMVNLHCELRILM